MASSLTVLQNTELVDQTINCASQLVEEEVQPDIMAQAVPNPPNERKRVKVYELRNNDWFDRGTGFCTADFTNVRDSTAKLYTCIVSFSRVYDINLTASYRAKMAAWTNHACLSSRKISQNVCS